MYTIEFEIKDQFNAIERTVAQVLSQKDDICAMLGKAKSLVVIGCGSSFSVAKSTAMQFSQYCGLPAYPLPAGDLLVNYEEYLPIISDAVLLVLSRSGSTSEVVRAVTRCKSEFKNPVLSICAKVGAPMEQLADVSVLIPWAFDEAVCQTRTVTNLYVAGLMTAAVTAGRTDIVRSLQGLHNAAASFVGPVETLAREFSEMDWNKAVVLADGAVAGLAEEGALAFKEICRRDSNYYHLLDVRHGPIVQIDENTLVIALISRGDFGLQADLIRDVAKHTSKILVCSARQEVENLGVRCLLLPDSGKDVVDAIFMIYCIQLINFYHATNRGVDPNQPEGLDAWIEL